MKCFIIFLKKVELVGIKARFYRIPKNVRTAPKANECEFCQWDNGKIPRWEFCDQGSIRELRLRTALLPDGAYVIPVLSSLRMLQFRRGSNCLPL
jgi:hypothetical protein